MKTTMVDMLDKDLTQEAPHSPRVRFGGSAILGRTVDKCRASLAGKLSFPIRLGIIRSLLKPE
jgi:hypothetical protein